MIHVLQYKLRALQSYAKVPCMFGHPANVNVQETVCWVAAEWKQKLQHCLSKQTDSRNMRCRSDASRDYAIAMPAFCRPWDSHVLCCTYVLTYSIQNIHTTPCKAFKTLINWHKLPSWLSFSAFLSHSHSVDLSFCCNYFFSNRTKNNNKQYTRDHRSVMSCLYNP